MKQSELEVGKEYPPETLVEVTMEYLSELQDDSEFLEALRMAGVDNWEWYDEAIRIYKENK